MPLETLELDPRNPRLPPSARDFGQEDLLQHIAERYNTVDVAISIARHGFFTSEPLIVMKGNSNKYVAVEGNRRLVSLRILSDIRLATGLSNERRWIDIQLEKAVPVEIPCVIATSRERIAAILGYRHISGIQEWNPPQKARFIAGLVNDGGMSFKEVAELVGEPETDIRSQYRNHGILEQARSEFGMDVAPVERQFGVFTRAMVSIPLRSYIGAPSPADVQPKQLPLESNSSGELGKLLSWLFGSEDEDRAISDSREITRLGRVIQDQEARAVLDNTRDLNAAEETLGGAKERLKQNLRNARNALQAALADVHGTRERRRCTNAY